MPIHARVTDVLRSRILGGDWPDGTRLPSEARLCEEFGTSRGTIRQALSTLRREGLITGGRGRSPIVRPQPLAQPFESFLSFTLFAERMGRTPGQRTIELARRGATPEAAEVLEIEPGTPVVDILRVRYLDGLPAMLERSSFVEPVGRLLFDFDPDKGSIYAYLISRGADLFAAQHTIDACAADSTDASLLEIPPGAPLLRERRRAVSREGIPLEYGDDRYRPDRVTFSIENVRETRPTLLRSISEPTTDLFRAASSGRTGSAANLR